MHTILGAGGAIGSVLLTELTNRGEHVRCVSRTAHNVSRSSESVPADLTNRQQIIDAVTGSSVVYLVAGIKYNLKEWQSTWPVIMQNTIEACKRANAKLVFFDNVYSYGKVDGAMTEDTPYNPCSKKGEVRARIATMLLDEMKAGNLTAMITRSADFYGPNIKTGIANILVFDNIAKNAKANVLINDSLPHSYTFTPDAAKAVAQLAMTDSGWNQTWHLPTALPAPTGKQFVEMVAKIFDVPPRDRVLSLWMMGILGIFDSTLREFPEMLYQNTSPYVFDSTKFTSSFNTQPTPYEEGIRIVAATYKK